MFSSFKRNYLRLLTIYWKRPFCGLELVSVSELLGQPVSTAEPVWILYNEHKITVSWKYVSSIQNFTMKYQMALGHRVLPAWEQYPLQNRTTHIAAQQRNPLSSLQASLSLATNLLDTETSLEFFSKTVCSLFLTQFYFRQCLLSMVVMGYIPRKAVENGDILFHSGFSSPLDKFIISKHFP